jgi:two-component system, chemotaxis family, chemotaxis protein CheY
VGGRSKKMKKMIMTVDDSLSIRQMVAMVLTKEGYEVIQAINGEDAETKLESNEVHMIITDLNMPKMDGIELIKKVRGMQKYKFIPIVMLTTESEQDKVFQGKAAGVTGWIIKPFRPEQLTAVVKKVLK